MTGLLPSVLATIAALASALALYLGSRHCAWRAVKPPADPAAAGDRHSPHSGPDDRGLRVIGLRSIGIALALASLAASIAGLGTGAGLCAMLATWMLALMAMPYLAACTRRGVRRAEPTATRHDAGYRASYGANPPGSLHAPRRAPEAPQEGT